MTVTERPPGGTVIDLVHRHLALWSTTDAAERRRRLPEIYADDVELLEPDAAVVGHDALDAATSALHAFPGTSTGVTHTRWVDTGLGLNAGRGRRE